MKGEIKKVEYKHYRIWQKYRDISDDVCEYSRKRGWKDTSLTEYGFVPHPRGGKTFCTLTLIG